MIRFRAHGRRRGGKGSLGQVVVEMLLILPVFLTIVFSIMEMGHLAFWMIVLNHATYEAARIGALTAGPDPGMGGGIKNVDGRMNDVMKKFINTARVESFQEKTLHDRQADQDNYDLVVTGIYEARLVFPISSILYSNPRGSGRKVLKATVRMPIEQPLHK